MDSFPAVAIGVVSGAPWGSQIEVNYSYNFGTYFGIVMVNRDSEGAECSSFGRNCYVAALRLEQMVYAAFLRRSLLTPPPDES